MDSERRNWRAGGSAEAGVGIALEPAELMLGGSTALGDTVAYRLAKISAATPIGGRWLDCGCNDGAYAAALREAGAAAVVGVDVSDRSIAEASSAWGHLDGVSFLVAAAEALPIEDESFDGVLMNEVLEHVTSQRQTLSEVRRVLVPGGHLAVFSPNRWFPFEGHGAVFGRVRAGFPFPLVPWLPQRLTWRTMTARNYWPRDLVATIRRSDFVIDRVGFAFPLFARYRWLPSRVIDLYRRNLSNLERSPVFGRFGVSTFVLAHKPSG